MAIAADRVQAAGARVVGDRIECCLRHSTDDVDRIERGMQWLGRHYSVTRNPGMMGGGWVLYYLYGLERAGRLTATAVHHVAFAGRSAQNGRLVSGRHRISGSQSRPAVRLLGQSGLWASTTQ